MRKTVMLVLIVMLGVFMVGCDNKSPVEPMGMSGNTSLAKATVYGTFKTAPTDTYYKVSYSGTQIDANVNDPLYDGYFAGNKRGTDFDVYMANDALIVFDGVQDVYVYDISGLVKYKNSAGFLITITSSGTYSMQELATGSNGACSKSQEESEAEWEIMENQYF